MLIKNLSTMNAVKRIAQELNHCGDKRDPWNVVSEANGTGRADFGNGYITRRDTPPITTGSTFTSTPKAWVMVGRAYQSTRKIGKGDSEMEITDTMLQAGFMAARYAIAITMPAEGECH